MSALVNTLTLLSLGIGGFVFGFAIIEWFGDNKQDTDQSANSEQLDVSVNTAILYLTVALLLSRVVTEWPPEGQRILPALEDPIFFGISLISAVIIGRVTRLIWKVELQRVV